MNGYQTIGTITIILLFVAIWFFFCISRAGKKIEDNDEQLN